MSNFEHGAVVAELDTGVDAARTSLQAATAAAASADVSRPASDPQASEMEEAGRASDAAHAKASLVTESSAIASKSVDNVNRALRRVGIAYQVVAEWVITAAAHDMALARQRYERAHEIADIVGAESALRIAAHALAALDAACAQVLARVAKEHIAGAASTEAYAASAQLGEFVDRNVGAGAWTKLLAA